MKGDRYMDPSRASGWVLTDWPGDARSRADSQPVLRCSGCHQPPVFYCCAAVHYYF